MNNSNCSTLINNNSLCNNNLIKLSFLKNSLSKNKINQNKNKKVTLNKNSKTQKHSPLILHTKLQKNHFNIKTKNNFVKNNNNNISQTPTVVFNVNLSKNKNNNNNIKTINNKNKKNKNIIKEKKLLLLNSKKNSSSSNINIHKKTKTTKNSPINNNNNKNNSNNNNNKSNSNPKKININNNNIHLRNKNNFFPVKNTSQLTLNYINNIMTKIKLTNFKTTPLTTINSKKSSNEKKIINKSKNNINTENKSKNKSKSNSNNKNKNNSINKIKNILIPNSNHYKTLHNKFSVLSNLTTKNNFKNITTNNNNNKIKNERNKKVINSITQISKSYNFNNNNNKNEITINNNNNKNNKSISNNKNNNNNNKINKKPKNIVKNYYIENINININFPTNNNNHNNNLIPITTNNNKNQKRNKYFNISNNNTTTSKKLNTSCNNTNSHNNKNNNNNNINKNKKKIKNNFTFKNYHLNERYFKNTKNIFHNNNNNNNFNNKNNSKSKTGNNTKIHKNPSNENKKKTNPITSTSSMLNSNKTNDISNNNNNNNNNNNINIKKKDLTPSISTSSIKDLYYYKSESKKIKDYIINYYKKNNFTYPKTTINFYKIGRSIGHGAFGKVNIALNILSGHIVAIKSFNKTKTSSYSKSQIKYEIKLLKKLRYHKNIVKIFETFETNKYTCIVMENVIGGNLLNCINKMTKLNENQSKNIFLQLINTLEYIHSLGIVHRDIKPDNILLDLNNNIKLCDFGVALQTTINNNENNNNNKSYYVNDKVGTPAFVAPEILSNNFYDPFKTDIWSAGVVLYSILAGIFPFRGNNEAELNKRILNGKFPNIDVSNDCMDLLKKILTVDPNERITIKEIKNHSWLQNNNVNNKINNNLFTNAEKIIYSKMLVDYRFGGKEDVIENFTYKNLETDLEDENKNNESFSFIITPYNTKINEYYNDDDEVYFQELIIEDNIMRFNPKINDFNVNYEIKFNKDADQGFVRKSGRKKNKMGSINNSLVDINKKNNINNNDKNVHHNENNNESENYLENKEIENNNIIITIEDDKKNNNEKNVNKKKNEFNNNIIKLIEDYGYKKDYILKSLENNELNHCTALYFIHLSLLNEK